MTVPVLRLASALPAEPEQAEGWRADAACALIDPALFYPQQGESTTEAKAVCRSCPVQHECLEEALANGEKFGIWGGLSERERRRIRRARRLAIVAQEAS